MLSGLGRWGGAWALRIAFSVIELSPMGTHPTPAGLLPAFFLRVQ